VGPVPPGADPEAYDRLRRRVLWSMPSGLYLLGSRAGQRRNVMTLNWATQLATEPKLVGVAVERHALTHQLVSEGGAFCLMILGREERPLVRRFTKPAQADLEASTLGGVAFRDGLSGAPVLERALAYLDCQVRQRLGLGSHTLFVGEVVDAGFQGPEGTPVLRMEDTRMSYGG
jgi:flavin reductase (DIM6/NTAB) family NADH-FMN oxidoreductase RutF